MSGLTLGTILNGVYVVPLILIPFLDREPKVQRPVEQPFWTALGLAACWSVFMFSIYSINGIIYEKWPGWSRAITLPDAVVLPIVNLFGLGVTSLDKVAVFGQHPFRYVTFTWDLLGWATWLTPIPFFFLVYWSLDHFKRRGGYEANINKTYYKVR